jgi:cytochrome c553
VGENIRFESAVQKAVREELQQWRSLETGKPVVPAEQPTQQNTGSLLNARCSKCHEHFTGKERITCEEYRAFDRYYMKVHNGLEGGEPVPTKMQAVLQALTEADFLNIKAEMHTLVEEKPAEDEPGVLR